MLSAKQGNYWYHFYNVFGMTRSLIGVLNPGPPALEASTIAKLSRKWKWTLIGLYWTFVTIPKLFKSILKLQKSVGA